MKIKSLVFAFCFFCFFSNAQKKQEIIDFINKIPTIEYGQLPYWHGITTYEIEELDIECLVHGFYNGDTINSEYNMLILNALCDDSYVLIKGEKYKVDSSNVFFTGPSYSTDLYMEEKSGRGYDAAFSPSLYASAKSVLKGGISVVYFWQATSTENAYYYAITFDSDGNLLSYQHLDFYVLIFPVFPFNSERNRVRDIDYPKSLVTYLPNNLILAKDVAVTEGGGIFTLSVLNDKGHFEALRSWEEIGNQKKIPVGKYMNYQSVGEEIVSDVKIPFVVHDKDGFSNIREKADAKSSIVRTINNGDMVWGRYLSNGWVKIDFTADKSGKIEEGGFIHSSRLENIYDEGSEFVRMSTREDWEKKINVNK